MMACYEFNSDCHFIRRPSVSNCPIERFLCACLQISIVCGGSYRRGKAESSDMDFVITHPDGHRLFYLFIYVPPFIVLHNA
jgi:hypothetical protein